MVNLKDILYESLKNYRNMRPYTQAELEKEVDEFLDDINSEYKSIKKEINQFF